MPVHPPAIEPPALPPVVKPPRPPRIGLALGGGAARGFAHIGVIQVLEEHGIRPDLVVGTSAGSLVAALYASGKSGTELVSMARTMDESALTDWAFPGRGLIRGEALARYVRSQTGNRLIEQMPLPWASWPPTPPAAIRCSSDVATPARPCGVQRRAGRLPAGAHRRAGVPGRRPGQPGAGPFRT
jgi:hypothetical protein